MRRTGQRAFAGREITLIRNGGSIPLENFEAGIRLNRALLEELAATGFSASFRRPLPARDRTR
jgi:hypothetical protein